MWIIQEKRRRWEEENKNWFLCRSIEHHMMDIAQWIIFGGVRY